PAHLLSAGDHIVPGLSAGDIKPARFGRQPIAGEVMGHAGGTVTVEVGDDRSDPVGGETPCGCAADLTGRSGNDCDVGHGVSSRDATSTTSVPVWATSPFSLTSWTDKVTIFVPGL